MPKVFSLASWNVEHFKDDPKRINRVIDFLARQKPDAFGLYEVEGKTVFTALVTTMPSYSFFITESPETQEILVGAKKDMTPFVTQKVEFKEGNPGYRPGTLLTVTVGGKNYPILFLHTASGTDPGGFGKRDEMFLRSLKFRTTLDKAAGGPGKANYIFLGDLNTMGLEYPFDQSIAADFELKRMDREAARKKNDMRRLSKDAPATFWNGTKSSLPASDLDQVFAANHLKFRLFGDAEITVRGWPQETTDQEKDAWIKDYSDHGLLYLEVHE
ncbi:MAG: hypothetical protein PHR28_12210 [candidate division Zixibacteria bacterium]|nr:hypothetical protein [candidate division Zixibacteria bacterium]